MKRFKISVQLLSSKIKTDRGYDDWIFFFANIPCLRLENFATGLIERSLNFQPVKIFKKVNTLAFEICDSVGLPHFSSKREIISLPAIIFKIKVSTTEIKTLAVVKKNDPPPTENIEKNQVQSRPGHVSPGLK